jgi:hypothetical protein
VSVGIWRDEIVMNETPKEQARHEAKGRCFVSSHRSSHTF